MSLKAAFRFSLEKVVYFVITLWPEIIYYNAKKLFHSKTYR